MTKKVTLDTLEVEEFEIPLPERTAPVEEASDEVPVRRLPPRWLWISALALVLLIAAGGATYWLVGAQKTVHLLPKKKDIPHTALSPAVPVATKVNDFTVTLQDDKGKYLVLTCDLSFELSAGRDAIFQQKILEVRRNIYEVLRKTRIVFPLGPRLMNALKEEINRALHSLLGQDAIKAIYFTKFVII